MANVSASVPTTLFYDFCGGVPFWDQDDIDQDTPLFSTCFIDTVLVWAPCLYLVVAIPFSMLYISKNKKLTPLPVSKLNIAKGAMSFVILCVVVLQLILQEHDGYGCQQDATISAASYTAIAVKFLAMLLTLFLQQHHRRKGVRSSAVPLMFWLFLILSELLSILTHASRKEKCAEDIVYFVYFGLLIVQLFLHFFAEKLSLPGYQELDNENMCPDEHASVLSRVTYNWLTPVVWKCYRAKCNMKEFWEQTSRLRSNHLGPLLENEWKAEIRKCQIAKRSLDKDDIEHHVDGNVNGNNGTTVNGNGVYSRQNSKNPFAEDTPLHESGKYGTYKTMGDRPEDNFPKPNLYKALFKCFWLVWAEATTYMGIGQIMWLVQPIVLKEIITIVEHKVTLYIPDWQGYVYACLLMLVLTTDSFMYHCAFHHMTTVGLRVKTALISVIYNKALTMNKNGLKASTVGEIVNLMSVDCQRIQDGFTFSFFFVLIFLMFFIAFFQLWGIMGVASMGGLGLVLLIMPLMMYIARKQYFIQKQLLKFKGSRIKILNEVISGIKVLKMYAWEPSFMRKIQEIREKEIKCLMDYAWLTSVSVLFAVHSPFMINFVLVLIYVYTSPSHALRAEEAFTALSIVNILRYPIALVPFFMNGAVQAFVSIRRIQEFLWTEDVNTANVNYVTNAEYDVNVRDGLFTWSVDVEKPALRSINLQVKPGELVAVVGPVGSGKSSLVSACLGEMEKLRGYVAIKGKIAYVPQEAWIQNMTLRDNILFGKQFYEKKYRKVINACALKTDLEILAGGDMTEIGEKGINISGGQKQRVSLARAVYNNADVYFLDDPLSAVDSHVGKHLFQKVIGNEGLLKNKTRILVTHGVHWLPMVDRILVLNDGEISESGTYEELISQDGVFAQFLHQYMLVDDEEDVSDEELSRVKDTIRTRVETMKSDGGLTSDDDALSASTRGRRRSQRISMLDAQAVLRRKSLTPMSEPDFSRLVEEETAEQGSVKPVVLLTYMKAMGLPAVVIVFLTMAIFQGLNVFSNFWLTYWTEDDVLGNASLYGEPEFTERTYYYLLMYLLFGFIQGIAVFASFALALTRMVRASGRLHNSMLNSILRAPMSFFDTTPIGRMMNRFSSDIDIMDNKLPESFRLWSIMMFSTIAVIVVVVVITPIFLVALLPIAVIYIFLVKFYLPTARQMRRTESVNRSPIYNHFSETITGSSVIRAFRCADRFVEESRKRVDENIKFYFASNTGARWIGIRLETLGNCIALLSTLFGLASADLNGAQVGLSITYAVQITITLNLVVFAISEMEMNIVSAERVNEYTNLPTEAGWVVEQSKPNPEWPSSGRIEFKNYLTRYREGLDLVLKGINCNIKDGEKVGIVGRTGAGKSSLTLCLFRLIESAGGAIYIDGINIAKIGLHDLRCKLTILPQDPVLFSGSLRSNLDPFHRYNDDNIWYALECAHLKEFVNAIEDGLEYDCGESGQNLSVGQRQLVCLARTLLHKTRVLILDEATAAVDMETDDLIQDTIRTQFKDCTIITVAHRLNTIMDYDRVMVLDAGLIKEFDTPQTLLANTDGVFYGMAKDANLV